jgi:hypothetical protein
MYGNLAISLNDNENHRTSVEYEDSLILKLFAFQSINSYAALVYIAFIKVWNFPTNYMLTLSNYFLHSIYME